MPEELSFVDLIHRVRAGDQEASTEFVRRYEPTIRIMVHARLNNPRLRRLLDSLDICQSVLCNFFVHVTAGKFDLETPAHLIRLLTTMAINRVTDHALKQQAARRDHRRTERASASGAEFVELGPGPSEVASGNELLEMFRSKLTSEERHLAAQRALGHSWAEIGKEVTASPDALRVQLARAVDRVTRELRLDQ
jgi:RNA polymerase sigma-70 factor (ECF subfamily)